MKVSDQLHSPAALSPGKEPPVYIEWEAEWTPELIWTRWRREQKFLRSWCRKSNPGHPAHSQVTLLSCPALSNVLCITKFKIHLPGPPGFDPVFHLKIRPHLLYRYDRAVRAPPPPLIIVGMMDASTTVSPLTRHTLTSGSATASELSCGPILNVPPPPPIEDRRLDVSQRALPVYLTFRLFFAVLKLRLLKFCFQPFHCICSGDFLHIMFPSTFSQYLYRHLGNGLIFLSRRKDQELFCRMFALLFGLSKVEITTTTKPRSRYVSAIFRAKPVFVTRSDIGLVSLYVR
jgi:hypothetical protein